MVGSLKASGLLYMVGDAALVTSELMRGNTNGAVGAALYGVAGLTTAVYGNPSAEKKFELLSGRISKHLHEQGIVLPEHGAISRDELAKDGGIIQTIEGFLYQHPSEILNALFAIGGTQLVKGGLAPKAGQSKDYMLAASGALVTTGALVGLLVPEKKHDANAPAPPDTFGKVKQWVEEKPLRATGYLYGLNNFTLLGSAYQDYKKSATQVGNAKYSYIPKLVTVATYFAANIFLSKSSKDNTKADGDEQKFYDALENASAQIILAQPPALQAKMLQQMAGYLSAQPEVTMPANVLAAQLETRLAQLAHTVAQGQSQWQSRTQAPTFSDPTFTR